MKTSRLIDHLADGLNGAPVRILDKTLHIQIPEHLRRRFDDDAPCICAHCLADPERMTWDTLAVSMKGNSNFAWTVHNPSLWWPVKKTS